jgi:sugar phosphate isomerase/epimerase
MTLNRRQLLQTATAAALAAGTPTWAAPAASSTKNTRLIPGLCAYSYNQQLRHGQMTLEMFLDQAVALRVESVDMTGYYLASHEPAYLYHLRQLAWKRALTFSGAACGVSTVQATADQRADTLVQIKQWVDVTDMLGAPHLRIFAGKLPPDVTLQQATDWTVETMKAACDYAGSKGVTLGVEDHSGVTQSADVCLEIMHRVNSPWAAINLDVTNFLETPTQDRYAQIAACIPFATQTHIRDHFDDQSPVDLERVWKLFAEAGFQGYMSVEYEPSKITKEPAETGVPKLVAQVRSLCAKYSSV